MHRGIAAGIVGGVLLVAGVYIWTKKRKKRATEDAVRTGSVRLFGKTHPVAELVSDARREIVQRLHAETQRQLGRGAELERILFVGGGAVALAEDIRDWFPNQTIAPHPAFANARGMLKYLRYVCQEPA